VRRQTVGRRLYVAIIIMLMLVVSIVAGCVEVSYPVKETYWENTTVSENHSETFSQVVPIVRAVSGEQALTPNIVWSNPELEYNGLKHFWYYGYSLPKHDESRVKVLFLKQRYYEFVRVYVYDFGERGQILAPPLISAGENVTSSTTALGDIGSWKNWINSSNTKLTYARTLAGISDLWLNGEENQIFEFDTHGSREIAIIISGPSTAPNCYFTTTLSWSDYSTENVTRAADHIVTSSIQQPTEITQSILKTKVVPFWEILLNR
jgi:hypothetical protein